MDQELLELTRLREESEELRRLMGIAYRFVADKDPESIKVEIMRAQIDYQPATAG